MVPKLEVYRKGGLFVFPLQMGSRQFLPKVHKRQDKAQLRPQRAHSLVGIKGVEGGLSTRHKR